MGFPFIPLNVHKFLAGDLKADSPVFFFLLSEVVWSRWQTDLSKSLQILDVAYNNITEVQGLPAQVRAREGLKRSSPKGFPRAFFSMQWIRAVIYVLASAAHKRIQANTPADRKEHRCKRTLDASPPRIRRIWSLALAAPAPPN